jgi:hypothetical protein
MVKLHGMRRSIIPSALLLGALALAGCDEPRAPAPPRPRETVIEMRSLLPLRANQRTLLELSAGRLFYHQPDATPELGLRMLDTTGETRITQLTPARVADLLGVPEGKPVLRAFAALSDGRIIGYFNGTHRARSLSCLVLYDPATQNVSLVSPPEELASVSGMGLTLDLADARVLRAGTTIWLCLVHSDQSEFLRLDARAVAAGTGRLARAFRSLRVEEGELRLMPDDKLAAQPDGTMWMFRPATGELWRINRDGEAFAGKQPENRPRLTTMPLVVSDGVSRADATRIWFFPAPRINPDQVTRPVFADDETRYPAIVYDSEKQQRTIERDQLIIRPAFPAYALRFTNWILDPSTADIIAYDAMSGEVFRLVRTTR